MSTFSLLKGENRLILKMGEQQLSLSAQDALLLAESLHSSAEEILRQEKERKLQQYVHSLMVWIDPGQFLMGSKPGVEVHREEVPQHTVVFPSGFSLAKVPITQRFFRMVMDYNPSQQVGDELPVESVSWYEALNFCNRLSSLTGREPCYEITGLQVYWNREANGYRLPTEAEWEYAAQQNGGEGPSLYAGSNHLDRVGWFRENCESTQPVGQKESTRSGIYDLSGNVFEWCFDRWSMYAEGRQTDPIGALEGPKRVCRGGAWNQDAWCTRLRFRYAEEPAAKCSNIGFRITCSET
ncbi:MAG: SUMF1/EgtB/PvdO family nonheme iron enzyme [Myxococcota bacterium]|nr:SUMF1/EgtB/PvdO family nonheme iron enzyme [Myxococcota bacterium]